jgi:hypothetical protein
MQTGDSWAELPVLLCSLSQAVSDTPEAERHVLTTHGQGRVSRQREPPHGRVSDTPLLPYVSDHPRLRAVRPGLGFQHTALSAWEARLRDDNGTDTESLRFRTVKLRCTRIPVGHTEMMTQWSTAKTEAPATLDTGAS